MRFCFALILGTFCFIGLANNDAYAQQKPNADREAFYRPVTSGDLVTKLPPRSNLEKRLGSQQTDFFSGSGGCPDEINIASIDEDSVFGNVDIEVVIENDIFIDCGR